MGIWNEILGILAAEVEKDGGNSSKTATRLGVSRVTLWSWMNDRKTPTRNTIFSALDRINVHVYDMNKPEEAVKDEKKQASAEDYDLVLKKAAETERQLRERIAFLEGQNELLKGLLNDTVFEKISISSFKKK